MKFSLFPWSKLHIGIVNVDIVETRGKLLRGQHLVADSGDLLIPIPTMAIHSRFILVKVCHQSFKQREKSQLSKNKDRIYVYSRVERINMHHHMFLCGSSRDNITKGLQHLIYFSIWNLKYQNKNCLQKLYMNQSLLNLSDPPE